MRCPVKASEPTLLLLLLDHADIAPVVDILRFLLVKELFPQKLTLKGLAYNATEVLAPGASRM